ncbi:hypothetical protein MMC28_010078 [Mycoblastus sanguinarius]|nr:hypothetical protein [Mycoblastus sanguinarius]
MAEVRSRRNQAKSIVARGQKRLNLSAKRPQTFLQSLLGRGNHARSKSENAEKKDIVSHAGKKLQILLLRRKQNHSRKEDDAIIEVSPHIDDPQTSTQPRCPILPRLPFQDSHEANSTFPFFALPPELRYQIIQHVLVPGDIHLEVYTRRWGFLQPDFQKFHLRLSETLSVTPSEKLSQWAHHIDRTRMTFPDSRFLIIDGSPKTPQPGFQLMAACKEIYEEGHAMFYSKNTFHLAPGPIVVTSNYFANLQSKHRDLIKSITITFSVADLTPEGFQRVEDEISHRKEWFGENVQSMSKDQQVNVWTQCSITTLRVLWQQKIDWLKAWPTKQVLMISKCRFVGVAGEQIVLHGQGRDMDLFQNRDGVQDTARAFFQNCSDGAERDLRRHFGRCTSKAVGSLRPRWVLDVEPVKDWLNGLGPGLRCKLS